MILYPAIDLKAGQCVRLYRGALDQATVFNDDPAGQARVFAAAGAEWIHVVDLDGAVSGKSANGEAVEKILRAVDVPIQLGGGIRHPDAIQAWLDKGVSRVVLGTMALRHPDVVTDCCRLYPGRIAVAIDAKDGKVAAGGWVEVSEVLATDLAKKFQDAGVAAIVFTDIGRDGTLEGPNVEATLALARAVSRPVIASGGIRSLDDLRELKASGSDRIAGVICGRALYEGLIDLPAAIRLLKD
ncbi:MAG: 1-(5-phosphoribosyl)-5-[(5-phosphoribosylamino)methylideneamino]imidazole-4-carboxamide isomerase [Rhodospirillales bacterium]|nr:1-(5-phosphoribosyl)-5-[(5-phosphoribosylamino)methylideneamino]imidazole-4-carboxamide isomerase [Rhodospirillales bacterium]